jgi:hypothetical protein
VYADKREEVTDGSKPIPLWQAREALDELEAAARGDEPFNHFAAGLVRSALEQAAAPEAPALGESNLPTTDDLEALYETTHYGHPADFAADVLERWGGWMPGLLGHGGALQDAVKIRERRAAPEAPAQCREPSPTAGMNMAQRILHVGGRNNAAGYVEFGSIQAVEALVRHVLRDLPDAPPAQASAVDERDRKDAERYRWLRDSLFSDDPYGLLEQAFGHLDKDQKPTAEDFDNGIDAALEQKGGAA